MLVTVAAALDGGFFGNQYNWYSFDEGMKEIRAKNQPGVVIIYKNWCGACRALGKRISNDERVIEFSKHFVMILAADEEEPEDEKWLPGIYCFLLLFYRWKRQILSSCFLCEWRWKY